MAGPALGRGEHCRRSRRTARRNRASRAAALLGEPPTQKPSYQITVSVLSVASQHDNLFCTG